MLSQLLLLPLMLASLLYLDRRERAEVEALVQEQCIEAPNRPQVGWLANQNLPSREMILWSRGARLPGFREEGRELAAADRATLEVLVVPRATERLHMPQLQHLHGRRRTR